MQFTSITLAFAALLSANSVLASIDNNGKFFDCQTAYIAQSTPRPPPCHNGKETMTKVYPATHLKEIRNTRGITEKGKDYGVCTVVIYPETSYPAVTATVTPCAQPKVAAFRMAAAPELVTKTVDATRPLKTSCVTRGARRLHVLPAVDVKPKTVTGKDNTVTVHRGKYFQRATTILPYCK